MKKDHDHMYDVELDEFFKEPEVKTNKSFIAIAAIMIILFLLGLGGVIYLAFLNNIPVRESKDAYYDSSVLVFPPGTEDWKIGYSGAYPFFYCKINGQWHKCHPVETNNLK